MEQDIRITAGRLTRVIGWIIVLAALGALIVAAAWRWGGVLWSLFRDRAALQTWIASFGAWAPLVSIMLNAAQVIIAPIPGQIIGLANGYLFGAWIGTLYSLIGVMIGTGSVLILTRRWGRPFVAQLIRGKQLEKLDSLITRRGVLFFFLIFLLPFLPDDLTCFAIGLTDLPLGPMFILIAIGRMPGLMAASWIGANAASLSTLGWIALIVGASLLGLAYLRWHDAIEDRLMQWIERVTER